MLKFLELAPSPNNIKVRLALRYKGIDFQATPADPRDRGSVIEVSGQELTPVIEDRGIVLNDSEAILQYLDANYRDRPRLFPPDRTGRKSAEDFKTRLDKVVVTHWLPVFLTAIGRRDSFEPSASRGFAGWLDTLEAELAGAEGFDSPGHAINDLRVAEWACYALPGAELVRRLPLFARFRELFAVDEASLPRLRAFLDPWNRRLG